MITAAALTRRLVESLIDHAEDRHLARDIKKWLQWDSAGRHGRPPYLPSIAIVNALSDRKSLQLRKYFEMLTNVKDRLVEALRRFDLYPNRGIDLAYQPRSPNTPDRRLLETPVDCRHGAPWTDCKVCSNPVHR